MAGPALLSMVLGVAMFGCDEKSESDTMGVSAGETDNDAGGETYAGPGWDESSTGNNQPEPGDSSDTISEPPGPTDDAGGETYAGPGWETTDGWEDDTTTGDTTTGGEDVGTTGTTAGDDLPDPTTDDAGGETYAGPGWEESTG